MICSWHNLPFPEYPLPLDLEAQCKQKRIDNTFAYGPVDDKAQQMIHQEPGQDQLDDAEDIIPHKDGRGLGIVFKYLVFIYEEVVQGADQT